MSVDVERGLIFAPTSSPSPDYYGGERLGANAYGNSGAPRGDGRGRLARPGGASRPLGLRRPAPPSLVTVVRDGQRVPAIVVGTKMGHLFVLHRETGAPLFPLEERPVLMT